MRKIISFPAVLLACASLMAAQNRVASGPTAASSDNDNAAASACGEGAIIGGVAAIFGALALDMLGGGGLVTALTAKVVVPAVVGGCITGALQDSVSRSKQQTPQRTPQQNRITAPTVAPSQGAASQPLARGETGRQETSVDGSGMIAHQDPAPPFRATDNAAGSGFSSFYNRATNPNQDSASGSRSTASVWQARPAIQGDGAQRYFDQAFQSRDADEQVRYYTQAIRLKPDYAAALYNRGLARLAQGDLAHARQDYDEAIRLNPSNAAFYSRGVAAARQQEYNAIAFCSRGAALQARGDLAGARQNYDEAIRLKSDNAVAFYNRALVRQAQRDPWGARQDFEMAFRLKPDLRRPVYSNWSH